jgi:hypothetical protein
MLPSPSFAGKRRARGLARAKRARGLDRSGVHELLVPHYLNLKNRTYFARM